MDEDDRKVTPSKHTNCPRQAQAEGEKAPQKTSGMKVVGCHWEGGVLHFAVADHAHDFVSEPQSEENGLSCIPVMPYDHTTGLDSALEAYVSEHLGMQQPQVDATFVERPNPEGWLYYLVVEQKTPVPVTENRGEAEALCGKVSKGMAWLKLPEALALLKGPDRQAVVRAVRHLSTGR